MTKTLQIRDVPEPIHRELRARAAAAGMSLSDFALGELARIAERPPVSEVLTRAASRSGGAATRDLVGAIRTGRDRH